MELTGFVWVVVLGCALLMDEGFCLTAERTLGKYHGQVRNTGTVGSMSTGGVPCFVDAGGLCEVLRWRQRKCCIPMPGLDHRNDAGADSWISKTK